MSPRAKRIEEQMRRTAARLQARGFIPEAEQLRAHADAVARAPSAPGRAVEKWLEKINEVIAA